MKKHSTVDSILFLFVGLLLCLFFTNSAMSENSYSSNKVANRWAGSIYKAHAKLVGDLDDDGELEVIIGSDYESESRIVCLDKYYRELWTFYGGSNRRMFSHYNLADVNEDKQLSIICLESRVVFNGKIEHNFVSINSKGELNWTRSLVDDDPIGLTVADILEDEDSVEIIAWTRNKRVVCMDKNAKDNIWIVDLSNKFKNDITNISIANLNGDNKQELIVTDNDNLVCLDNEGEIKWEKNLEGTSGLPVLADLNNDGLMEIILRLEGQKNDIACLNCFGRIRWQDSVEGQISKDPAVADLDGDGKLEIVVDVVDPFKIICLNDFGVIKWETDLDCSEKSYVFSSPIIGAVSGGPKKEIILGVNDYFEPNENYPNSIFGKLICVNSQGEARWAQGYINTITIPEILADLDGDGLLEIILSNYYLKLQGRLCIYHNKYSDYNGSFFSPQENLGKIDPLAWTTHRQNLQRTNSVSKVARKMEKRKIGSGTNLKANVNYNAIWKKDDGIVVKYDLRKDESKNFNLNPPACSLIVEGLSKDLILYKTINNRYYSSYKLWLASIYSDNKIFVAEGYIHSPSISYNGSEVAYIKDYKSIYLFTNNNTKRIYERPANRISYIINAKVSGDGNYIVWSEYVINEGLSVYKYSLKESKIVEVVLNRYKYCIYPKISYDASKIVWEDADNQIFLYNSEDKEITQVSSIEGNNMSPEISPDGNYIVWINVNYEEEANKQYSFYLYDTRRKKSGKLPVEASSDYFSSLVVFNDVIVWQEYPNDIYTMPLCIDDSFFEKEAVYHSADYNKDWKIDWDELWRVIDYYRKGYHPDPTTIDGFAPGYVDPSTIKNKVYHSSDYIQKDYKINLSELLRLIQIYNSKDGYRSDSKSEDGFSVEVLY